jgi:DNA-binding MarR family transcriptional regulator
MLIGKTARQELIQHLNEVGIDLPPQQFMVLIAIGGRTLTLGELSREMDLDPSTLAPIIEQSVRRGLVKRQRDPSDRRRIPLRLTAEGTKLIDVIKQMNEYSAFTKSLALMGEEKTQQLLLLLEEFVNNLLALSHDSTQSQQFNDKGNRGQTV